MRTSENEISSEVFDQLQTSSQYRVVREFGQPLSVKASFQYLVTVYSLFDYYVAVWKEAHRSGVHDIHLVDPVSMDDQWYFASIGQEN